MDNAGGIVYRGFPVGAALERTEAGDSTPKKHYYLYNHVKIIVRYSERSEEHKGIRIVGFEVIPFSVKVLVVSVFLRLFL